LNSSSKPPRPPTARRTSKNLMPAQ
jgi:hypothetical protein